MIKDGWFVESTELNFHLLVARCSIVFASNAILLTHFVYRYLVIHESNFTKKYFGWYIAASFLIFGLFFGVWYAICYHLARVNIEIRQYIREDFRETYGTDSKNYNMIGVLFQVLLLLQWKQWYFWYKFKKNWHGSSVHSFKSRAAPVGKLIKTTTLALAWF